MTCSTIRDIADTIAEKYNINIDDAIKLVEQQQDIIYTENKEDASAMNIAFNDIDYSKVEGIEKTINIWSTDHNGYSTLSNMFVGPIRTKGYIFPTVEHLFQYSKAVFFKDKAAQEAILNDTSDNGFNAQKIGQTVNDYRTGSKRPFNVEAWNEVAADKLYKSMLLGFMQDSESRKLLVSTGDARFTHKDPKSKKNNVWSESYPKFLSDIRSIVSNIDNSDEIESSNGIIYPGSIEDITLHFGAAYGADKLFYLIMHDIGVRNQKHYLIDNKSEWNKTNKEINAKGYVVPVSQQDIDEGHREAEKAINFLGRKKYYRSNLTARNWFQVKNSTQVVAITKIVEPGGVVGVSKDGNTEYFNETDHKIPTGGTAMAISMAINRGIEVNVFDYTQKKWFQYDYSKKDFVVSEAPILAKDFAGIGSREIEETEAASFVDGGGSTINYKRATGKFNQDAVNAIYEAIEKTKQYIKNNNNDSESYYIGQITELNNNDVLVFGTNQSGFHGAGSAAFATFGDSSVNYRNTDYSTLPDGTKGKYAVKGVSEGMMHGTHGASYGLPTVSKYNQSTRKFDPLTKDEIISSIKKLYSEAVKTENQDKRFLIAYAGSLDAINNNGYTNKEMADMFVEAGVIPKNIIFNQNLYNYIHSKKTVNEYKNSIHEEVAKDRYVDVVSNFYSEEEVESIKSKIENEFAKPGYTKSNKKGHLGIVYGEVDYTYNVYNGTVTHEAKSIPDFIAKIARDAEKANGYGEGYYNHILINRFEDGVDIYKHTDADSIYVDENFEIGSVAVYSIGHTAGKHWFWNTSLSVEHNSLSTMSSGDIPHSVAPAAGVRYSITMRNIPETSPFTVTNPLVKAKKITSEKQISATDPKLNGQYRGKMFYFSDMDDAGKNILVTRISSRDTRQYKHGMNRVRNFGNPFVVNGKGGDKLNSWEFEAGNPSKVSMDYYRWLTEDDYLPEGAPDHHALKTKKEWILNNLDLVRNAENLIYWKSPNDDVTHVDALVAVAEFYSKGKKPSTNNGATSMESTIGETGKVPLVLSNLIFKLSEAQKKEARKYWKDNTGKKTYQDMYDVLYDKFISPKPVPVEIDTNYEGKYDDDAYLLQGKYNASPDQKVLIDKAVEIFVNDDPLLENNILFVHGMGGTGKSTTIGRAIELAQKELNGNLMFQGMTFTHAAKGVLRDMSSTMDNSKISIQVETTSSFLSLMNDDSQWIIDPNTDLPVVDNFRNSVKRKRSDGGEYDASPMKSFNEIKNKMNVEKYIIVVDETSMIDYKELTQLLAIAQNSGLAGHIKIVFMGDYHQLPPVGSIAKATVNNESHIFAPYTNKELPLSPAMASILGYDTFNPDSPSQSIKDLNARILKAQNVMLTTQNRQSVDSDLYKIIQNAAKRMERELIRVGANTTIRGEIESISPKNDSVSILSGENPIEKRDLFRKLFRDGDPNKSKYITFNNKNVVQANQDIRLIMFDDIAGVDEDSLPDIVPGRENMVFYDNHNQPQPELTNGLQIKITHAEPVENSNGVEIGEASPGKGSRIKFRAKYKPGIELTKITYEYEKISSSGQKSIKTESSIIPSDIFSKVQRESLNPGSVIVRSGKLRGVPFSSVREIYLAIIRESTEIESVYPDGRSFPKKYPKDDELLLFGSFLPMYYSYAISTYKSQGQSIDNVIYDARFAAGREENQIQRLANEYTAMSRAKKNLYVLNASANILGDMTTVENENTDTKNIQGSDSLNSSFYNEDLGDIYAGSIDFNFGSEEGQDSLFSIMNNLFEMDAQQTEPGEQTLRIYSQEFLDHQRSIIGSIEQAFENGATSKITYEEVMTTLDGSIDRATTGFIEHNADGSAKIKLRWNKYNGTARKSEIFLHEMVHFMTQRAYAISPDIQILIKELQKVVRDAGLTYEIFLTDIYNQGLEPTAYDIQIAKDKYEYAIGSVADPEEFFAYAATNEHLFNAIKDIKISPKIIENLDVGTKRGIVRNVKMFINRLIDMINEIWASQAEASGKTGAELITDTMMKLSSLQAQMDVENAMAFEDNVDESVDEKILNEMDEKIAPWVKKFDDAVEDLHSKTKKNSSFKKIVKAAQKVSLINRMIESNIIQNIYTSVTQKTNSEKWAHLYRLYRIGKNFTEKHRQGLSDAIGRVVAPYFEDIDKNTRSAISKIIFKLDMPSLLDEENGIDFSELKVILDDSNKLDLIVQAAKNEVEKEYKNMYDDYEENFNDAIEQADGLATYLNEGKVVVANQQLNAENIYSQFHKSGTKDSTLIDVLSSYDADDKKAISALDRYITYKALQMSSTEDKKLVKRYLKSDKNVKNIKNMVNMYKEFVINAVDDLNVTIYNPIPKGFFESLNKSQMKYEIIAEDEVDYYEGMFGNMTNIGEYGTINGVKYYKLVGRGHEVGFDEGMISIAGTTIEGISLKSILINNMVVANKKKKKHERESRQAMENRVTQILDNFIASGGKDTSIFKGVEGNMPIPVYDFSGSVIDYKIQPTTYDKVKHMKYSLDVVESAKYTLTKLQHRQASVIHNKEVIDTLLDFHEKHAIEDADEFITIKRQEENEQFNEDIHGRWNRIPEYTRNYIFMKTGKHSLTIPKSMLELITGERRVTFSNFNIGPIDIRNNPKMQKMILAIEDYIAEVFGWLKETIAIRMGNVVGANTISNMIQAWRHGKIGPIEYIERARRKWQELNEYRELVAELNDEKVKLVAQGENQERSTLHKIRILEQRINKNPFHILVNDGQFSPIIEDINVEEDGANGHIAQKIEDAFNTNKFTRGVKPIKEVLFLDRNTKIYQAMMKFTQYGDIITREILREKREEDAIKAGRPMSDRERQAYLDFLDQLFVNYSYIDNRFIKYGERILAIFFTKYLLRQAKAMQTVIAENPGRFLASILAEEVTGYDVETAEDAYYEPITSLMNKLGFLHPGRVFDSITDVPIFGVVPDATAFAHKA